MRVVVTGGAGFIGTHVSAELVAAGHDVVVVDALLRGGAPRLPAGVEHRRFDLADRHACRDAVEGAEAVCHQASRVGLGVDFADVGAYVHDNDVGTATLLWALHETSFVGRVVLASSMVVYGEGGYRCAEHGALPAPRRRRADLDAGWYEPRCPACGGDLEPTAVEEGAPLDPRNVYAATKVHQEHLCAVFGREHDVPVTILRYHNVYGPGFPRDTPYAGVASIFCSQLAAGQRPQVFEDGGQRRDFVHVADVARANLLALTAPAPYDGPLNVASGQPCTLLEMAALLALGSATGLAPEVVGGYRLGDVRHVVASPERAARVLGFAAKVGPADGLAGLAADSFGHQRGP